MADRFDCKKFSLDKFTKCIEKDNLEYWKSLCLRTETLNTYVRTNIKTEVEFSDFLKTVEEEAKVNFTVEVSTSTSDKFVFNKVFRCHHGTHKMRSGTAVPYKKTGQVNK